MKKRIMSLILAFAMIMTMIPQTAFAEEEIQFGFRTAGVSDDGPMIDESGDLCAFLDSTIGITDTWSFRYLDNGVERVVLADEMYSTNEEVVEISQHEQYPELTVLSVKGYGRAYVCYDVNGVTYRVTVECNLPDWSFSTTPELTADSVVDEFKVTDVNDVLYFALTEGRNIETIQLEGEFNDIATVEIDESKTFATITFTELPKDGEYYSLFGTFTYEFDREEEYNFDQTIYLLDRSPGLVYRGADWGEDGPFENPEYSLSKAMYPSIGYEYDIYVYLEVDGELTLIQPEDLYSTNESAVRLKDSGYSNLVRLEILKYGESKLCYNKDGKVYSMSVIMDLPSSGFCSTPEYNLDTYLYDFTVTDENNTIYYASKDIQEIESFELSEEFDKIADYTISADKKYVEINFTGVPNYNVEYEVTGELYHEEWGYNNFSDYILLKHDNAALMYRYADWSEDGYWGNPEWDLYDSWRGIPGESGIITFYYVENGMETPVAFNELYVADDSIIEMYSDEYIQGMVSVEALREGNTTINYVKDGVTYSVDVNVVLPRVGFYSKPEISGENYLQRFTVTQDKNTVYLVAKDGWKFIEVEEMDGEPAGHATATVSEDKTYVSIQFAEDVPDGEFSIGSRIYNENNNEEWNWNLLTIENGKPALVYKYLHYDGSEYVEEEGNYYNKSYITSYGYGDLVHFYYKEGDEVRLLEASEVKSADESIVTISEVNASEYFADITAVGVGETEFCYTYEGKTYTLPVTVPLPLAGAYSTPVASEDTFISEFNLTEDSKEFYIVARDGWKISSIFSYDNFENYVEIEMSDDNKYAKVTPSVNIMDDEYWVNIYMYDDDEGSASESFRIDINNHLPGLKYRYAYLEDGEIVEGDGAFYSSWNNYPNYTPSLIFYYCENGIQTKVKSSELKIANDDIITLTPINGDEYAVDMKAVDCGKTTINYTIDGKTYGVNVNIELPEFGFYTSPTSSATTYIEEFKYYGEQDTFFLVPINGWTLENVRVEKQYEDLVDITVDSLGKAFVAITIKDAKFDDTWLYLIYDAVNNTTGESFTDGERGIYLENGNPDLKFHYGHFEDDEPVEETYQWYENTLWGRKGNSNFVYLYLVENGEATPVTYDNVKSSNESVVKVKEFQRDPNATMLEIVGFGSATIDYVLDGETLSMNVVSELGYEGFFSEPVFSEETYISEFTVTDENNTFYYILDEEDECIESIEFKGGLSGIAEGRFVADNIAEIKITGTPEDGIWGGVVLRVRNTVYDYTYEIERGLNLYSGKAALKFHWGEYYEDGLFEVVDDRFSDRWHTEPGNSAVMYFYMVSGDSQTRVTYDQLESSNPNVVKVVKEYADSDATRLEAVGFGEATIYYTVDGVTYSIDVVSELPDVGFYSELDSWASEETFITEFTVTDENKSFYIIPKQGYYIQNPLLSSDFFEIAELYVDARGYARVDILGVPQDGRYYDVFFEVGNMENPNEVREGHRGIRLFNGMPSLKFNWGEWNNDNLFENTNDEMQSFWRTCPGNSSTMYFYTVKDGEATRAIFEQLSSTNEDVVIIKEENRDSRAVRLEVVGFGNAEIKCTVDGVEYSMKVESTLPSVGFYSRTTASKATYLTEFDFTEENNTFYLVSDGELLISNPRITNEFADIAKVELDESGMFARITITGTPEDGRWLHVEYEVTNVDNPNDTWTSGRGIEVKNNMPALKYRWVNWDENDNMFENLDSELVGTWHAACGDSSPMYFYAVKDGEEIHVPYTMLKSSDENVVVVTREREDSRASRIDVVGFGEATIYCTIDGVTYSMPIVSRLPQAGFYTTSTPSEETYIKEFDLTEDNNKFYLVSNGDVTISLPMNAEGLYDIAQVTLDSSRMFAEIEITGQPENGIWYGMLFGVTSVENPDDSWENHREIKINNLLPGLKYRWGEFDDEGTLIENTDYSLESTWYTNPGYEGDVFIYYLNNGVETKVKASELTSSNENIVKVCAADDAYGIRIETVGFGKASIDYVVDGKTYSIPVESELPGFGFYSTNEVSEESYLYEYVITEDTSVIYLLANEDYYMSDVVLDEEFAQFASIEESEDGKCATITITGEPMWDGHYAAYFIGHHEDYPEDSWESAVDIRLVDRKPGLKWVWSDLDETEDNLPFEKEMWASPGDGYEVCVYYVDATGETKLSFEDIKSSDENIVRIVEAEDDAVVIEVVGLGIAQIIYTDENGEEYSFNVYSEMPSFGFYDECEATADNLLAGEVEITDDDNEFYFMALYDFLIDNVELSDEVKEFATAELSEDRRYVKVTINEEFEEGFFEMFVQVSYEEGYGDSGYVGIELINRQSSLVFCWPDENGEASDEFFDTLYTALGYDENAFIYHVTTDGETILSIEDLEVSDSSIVRLEEAENGMIKVVPLDWGGAKITYTVGGKTYDCTVISYVPEVGYFDEPVRDAENWIQNEVTITDDDNVFYFMTTEEIVIDRIEFETDVKDFVTMEVSEDRTLVTLTVEGEFDEFYLNLSYDLSNPYGWKRSSSHGTYVVDGRTPEQPGDPDEPFVPVVPDGVDYAPYYDAATSTIHGIKVGDEVEVGTVFSGNNLEEGQMLAFGYKAYDTDVIFGYSMLFDRGLYTVGEEDGNFDPADGWVVGSVHYNEIEDMLEISMVSKVPPVQINPINISVDWSKLKEFKVGEQVPEQVEAVSITGEGVARVWPADVLFAVREEHIDKGYITDEEYHNAILENSGWWYVRWVDDKFIASAGDEFAVRVDASSEIGYVFAYTDSEQITGNIILNTDDIVVLKASAYVGDYAGMAAAFDIKLGSIEKISEKANPVVILKGWQYIDGNWYFYDNNGERVTNQWRKDSKGWCYLGEDGAMLTSQWVKDSKGYCFVDASGYMVYNQWCDDGNGLAYAGSDGYRQSNKWIQDSKGWSYVDETGYKVYSEWISGCYIDDTGYMATNKWIETDDGWLYMGANGYKTTNKWMQRAGKWLYLGADGYALTNQWVKDSTGWCYVDENGFMVYEQWVADSKGLCYVGTNGYLVTNQWIETETGLCYVDGSGYKVTNNWVKDSNGLCYLGADGHKVSNQWVEDATGSCYIGANGYVVTNQWIETDNGWCYVGANGYMTTNSWMKRSGEWCYLGTDGYVVTNDWAKDGSRWCYMDENGFMTKAQWINDGTGSCYMDANGYLTTNKWLTVDGEWVYVGNSGYMVVSAWAKDSKGWCYLDENGHMVYNDWVADSKGEVYLDASGYMVTNKWVAVEDKWCYVGSDGYKVTSQWRKDSKGWCYLGEDGFMLTCQWVKDSVGYCYVDEGGYIVYNQWVEYDGNTYYVNASGYRVEKAWAKIDGNWYYFKEEGVMARDEYIGSDYVDENGVYV